MPFETKLNHWGHTLQITNLHFAPEPYGQPRYSLVKLLVRHRYDWVWEMYLPLNHASSFDFNGLLADNS